MNNRREDGSENHGDKRLDLIDSKKVESGCSFQPHGGSS